MEDFYFVAAVPSGFENGLFEARQAHFYNHSMSLIFLAAAGYLWKFISLNQVIIGIFNQTSVATLNIKNFKRCEYSFIYSKWILIPNRYKL